MTVYEILDIAFGMAGERLDDFPDKRLPLIWLNVTMAEATKAENAIREKQNVPQIALMHMVTSLSDTVDMDQEICRVCLPLGVAAFLHSDRENDYLSAHFRNRFIDSLQTAAGMREESISDCYGGEL
ncbi:MAG: hypothetical protein IJ410_05970 [Oscillospiraceae bacterium]|nr:hypothetical protein [Oscillospiraceae bacterium]